MIYISHYFRGLVRGFYKRTTCKTRQSWMRYVLYAALLAVALIPWLLSEDSLLNGTCIPVLHKIIVSSRGNQVAGTIRHPLIYCLYLQLWGNAGHCGAVKVISLFMPIDFPSPHLCLYSPVQPCSMILQRPDSSAEAWAIGEEFKQSHDSIVFIYHKVT